MIRAAGTTCPRSGAMRATPGLRIPEDNPALALRRLGVAQQAVGMLESSARRHPVGRTAMTGRGILVRGRMAGKLGKKNEVTHDVWK